MLSRIPWGTRIFALIWLVVALIRPLHEPFLARIAFFYGGSGIPYIPILKAPSAPAPDDLMALSEDFTSQFFLQRNPGIFRQWDQLAAQHPEAVWLRADRLRATTIEGDSPRWMTAEVVTETIACARAGRQIEPDNGFWAWMEAAFALKAGRKTETLNALRYASRAPRWNDYVNDFTRRRIALRERENPLIYEEKMTLQAVQLYSHLSWLRSTCQPFAKQALLLLSRGDQKGAFELLDPVLGAARGLRRNSDSLTVSSTGFSIEQSVWRQVAATAGVSIRANSGDESDWQRAVNAFGQVAGRAGRSNLSRIAQLELQGGFQDRHAAEVVNDSNLVDSFARANLGVSEAMLRIGTQGAFLLTYAALLAFAGALCWIFGRIWTSVETIAPTRGEVAKSANFSFWSIIGVFALLWYLNVGSNFVLLFFQLVGPESFLFQSRQAAIVALPVIALLTWLLPIAWATKRGSHQQPKFQEKTKEKIVPPRAIVLIRILLRFFCIALCAIALGSGAEVWEGTVFAFPVPHFAAAFCLLGLLLVETFLWKRGESSVSLRNPVSGALGLALLVLVTTGVVITRSPLALFWQLPALVAIGFVLSLLSWERSGGSRSPAFDFFMAGATRSAGILAVAWSLFFLLGAVVVWPVRAKMNHQLDRMLVMGERAWRAEQTQ